MEDRELYDVRSASRRVKRSRWTVYRWMHEGLPFRTVNGRRYIAHDDLLLMLRTKIQNEQRHQFSRTVPAHPLSGGPPPDVHTYRRASATL
jgi:hypothetical protein